MKKLKKISKVVWFDETETRLPQIEIIYGEENICNPDQIRICCSSFKPKQNAKRIRITVEEI